MRTLQTIDYAEAKRAIDLIVEKALQMQKAASVAVADVHGDLICFARMDGAPVSSIRIAMNKAWTAARERKSTKEIGEKVKHSEKSHDIAYYGDPNYVGWGGGIPVSRMAKSSALSPSAASLPPKTSPWQPWVSSSWRTPSPRRCSCFVTQIIFYRGGANSMQNSSQLRGTSDSEGLPALRRYRICCQARGHQW